MNFHDLDAFVAVVETGSIVAACDRLKLTQPAISRRLQSLEAALGAPLLDRASKPLRPTADGCKAYEMSRRVLAAIAELRSTLAPDRALVGEWRLGVTALLSDRCLAGPLAALHEAFPQLTVRVATAYSAELAARVRAGALDAAIVCLAAGAEPPRELGAVPLARLDAVVVAGATLGLPRRVRLEELAPFPWIMSLDGCGLRDAAKRAIESAGLSFRLAFEALDPELRLALVARGAGIGLTTPPVLESTRYRAALRTVAVADFGLTLKCWLVHRPRSVRFAPVIDRLHESMSGTLAPHGKTRRH